MSHAHVAEGFDPNTGSKQWRILPAWGLDYDYVFTEKWALGLHSDVVVETYDVETADGKVLKRTRPLASALLGTYKLNQHLALQLGLGGEFAKEETFALTRVGIEYGWELPGAFELSGVFNYDFKWNAYDTFLIGIGVAKLIR
jgi:hypothetical protein